MKDMDADEVEKVAEDQFVKLKQDDSIDMDDESGDFDLES